jgi:phosphatidylserine/phosphatidylglycerophosphate/cardiolipin synthase-like enzyme
MRKDRKRHTLSTTLFILGAVISIILGVAILLDELQDISPLSEETRVPHENGTIKACFTRQEDCRPLLTGILENATSVKAALYDLNEPSILNALKKKNADLLIDEDNYFGLGKNISKPGLMHDKFYIIYNSSGLDYVVTGSANPTKTDFSKNDNNILVIGSAYLQRNYEAEFSSIKSGNHEKKPIAGLHHQIIFDGFPMENYFCPEDDCEGHVLQALRQAKQSIRFMTFSFTSNGIGDLIVSKRDSLDIEGMFDKGQVASNGEYSEYKKMKDAGMRVKMSTGTGKLHHKVFIIDNETVITGSYNPTYSGDELNDENILILHSQAIAGQYLAEFERIWNI